MVAADESGLRDVSWTAVERTPPRTVCPTNGIRFGPDGSLYVASAYSSVIARVDVDSGRVEIASPVGDAIVSPDDLDFDSTGRMYVAECMDARVTERDVDGTTRVVADGIPGANGITVYEDRIFVNECRPDGRFFEVFRDDRKPKLLASHIPFTNGCDVSPEREIYYPRIMSGEVWKMSVDGGESTLVAGGLSGPSAVKIKDGRIYVCEGHSGEVSEIKEDGSRQLLAQLRRGIDSIDISSDGRIFASHWQDGEIVEVAEGGQPRTIVPAGLIGPYGMAAAADGTLYVADGARLLSLTDENGLTTIFRALFDPGMLGMLRGISIDQNGRLLVTSASGEAYRFDPLTGASESLASGLDELMGVIEVGDDVLLAEAGTGRIIAVDNAGKVRVVAENIARPVGLAASGDVIYVSASQTGEVIALEQDGSSRVIASGFERPEGIAVSEGRLLVVDAARRELAAIDLDTFAVEVAARNLPVGGAPAGVTKPRLNGVPEVIPGPFTPYADVAVSGGRVFVSGDANGTILELQPN